MEWGEKFGRAKKIYNSYITECINNNTQYVTSVWSTRLSVWLAICLSNFYLTNYKVSESFFKKFWDKSTSHTFCGTQSFKTTVQVIPRNYSLSFRSNTKTCGCISFQTNTSHIQHPFYPTIRSTTIIMYLLLRCFSSYVFPITPTLMALQKNVNWINNCL
jgi:hypothetical protein